MTTAISSASRARIKTVALPAEHGAWSLVAEPILLGLLVAPSWAGLSLALATFFAFLAQRLGLVGVALRTWWDLLPWTAVVAMLVLLFRATRRLSRWRRQLSTKTLGFVEMGLGLLTAVLVAIGFTL